MEAVNYLTRASDDQCYLKFKARESMGPMLYSMTQQYPATCPPDLPLTSECKGFHVGPAGINDQTTYRLGVQNYNLGQDFGRPATQLMERSTYRAGGEGRFSDTAIVTESALQAPAMSVDSTCRRRLTEERMWATWQYLPCPNTVVEPFNRAGLATRVDVYCQ
jgi:hypothetical protein